MSSGYLVVEEYVFYISALSEPVKGRVVMQDMDGKQNWRWDTSHTDGRHTLRDGNSLEAARAELLSYMEDFDASGKVTKEYY